MPGAAQLPPKSLHVAAHPGHRTTSSGNRHDVTQLPLIAGRPPTLASAPDAGPGTVIEPLVLGLLLPAAAPRHVVSECYARLRCLSKGTTAMETLATRKLASALIESTLDIDNQVVIFASDPGSGLVILDKVHNRDGQDARE